MPERRKYDSEFREETVTIVRETGKPIGEVARDPSMAQIPACHDGAEPGERPIRASGALPGQAKMSRWCRPWLSTSSAKALARSALAWNWASMGATRRRG